MSVSAFAPDYANRRRDVFAQLLALQQKYLTAEDDYNHLDKTAESHGKCKEAAYEAAAEAYLSIEEVIQTNRAYLPEHFANVRVIIEPVNFNKEIAESYLGAEPRPEGSLWLQSITVSK